MRRSHLAILALTPLLALAACDQMAGPAGPAPAPASAFDQAAPVGLKAPVALAGGAVVTYGFEDAPIDCGLGGVLTTPYQDLVFLTDPVYLAPCDDGLGNVFLIPSLDPLGDLQEIQVQLPAPVESASLSVFSYDPGGYFPDPVLVAYDADGNVLATASMDVPGAWAVLTVSAAGIERLGLALPQQAVLVDDLTLVYPSSNDPAAKDDCKKGGWEAFGFKNQGQCVRFVETGKDSRG